MVLFSALQVLDVELTLLVLALGGYEANPLMAWLVGLGPIEGLLLGKVVAFGLFLLMKRFRPAGVRKVQVFYVGVVAWNLAVLAIGSAV